MARAPLYKTAETEMIRRIRSGDWAVGHRLPNEFVLADEFGISQGTMRRALMTLEGMGLLDRKPGRGTLVAQPRPADASATAESAPASRGSGTLIDTTGAPLAFEVYRARAATRGATPAEETLLGSGRIATLDRVLRRGGTRAALDEVAVPEALIPALDEDAAPDLPTLLSDAGIRPATIDDQLTAAVTTMTQSVALSCDRHTPLLVLTRTARDRHGAALARQTLLAIAEDIAFRP